jgi:NAD-dependent SIR2 family protein deacetylase
MGKRGSATNSTSESRRKRQAKWWKANAKRIREELRCKPEYRYQALKLRCKREKRKFSISFKTYLTKLKKGCIYCGASIMKEVGGGMDRLNNNNPNYFSRGLVPCCSSCNKVKSNQLSFNEMVVAMRAVNKYRRSKRK